MHDRSAAAAPTILFESPAPAVDAGAFRFVRYVSGESSKPALVIRDDVTSTGTPVTVQIETGRLTGSFLKGTSGGNTYFEVSAAGAITASGLATVENILITDPVYDDIVVGGAGMRLPASSAPGPSAWKTDLLLPDFSAAGSEYAHFGMQLPHNYVAGTNLLWHVHFANAASITDLQTVIFRFRFTMGAINGEMVALGNADATFTNNAAARAAITAVSPGQISGTTILADTHLIAGGATITGTTLGLSSVLYGRLERLNADTYAGNALLLSADAHIQKNRLGSENEYTG
jgi:hypothetical protein